MNNAEWFAGAIAQGEEEVKLTRDEHMRAEGAISALDVAGERIAALTAERDEAMKLAQASERWRLAYQDGKMKLYELGGEVAEAALTHLPCNEGGIDRLSRKIFLYPHFEVWKAERDALRASNARLRETLASCSAILACITRAILANHRLNALEAIDAKQKEIMAALAEEQK